MHVLSVQDTKCCVNVLYIAEVIILYSTSTILMVLLS